MKTFDVNKKNRRKAVRAVLQALALLLIGFFVVRMVAFPKRYQAYVPNVNMAAAANSKSGFVAISYFGVENTDTHSNTILPNWRLDEHLAALKASGFQTITQQDILDYYNAGKPLPDKALFLFFEDGRKDTVLLAHQLLEKYNYKASIFQYAQALVKPDPIFVNGRDLRDLLATTFWETASNGYRLSYINVFDRWGNYFGELNSNEFRSVSRYLARRYNHYLMDYIRDADEVPKESTAQMAGRIAQDYELMQSIYARELGQPPMAYGLMHANSGKFGTHDHASQENQRWIQETFRMNFNREGFTYNDRSGSIYDLTRMQPQASWFTNHLLMRIQAETGQAVAFVAGDAPRGEAFEVMEGKAEFGADQIALTSTFQGRGLMRLQRDVPADIEVNVRLLGNMVGSQEIYLRADAQGKNYLAAVLANNQISIHQALDGQDSELYHLDLSELDKMPVVSKEQNEHEGLLALQNTIIQYDEDDQRKRLAEEKRQQLAAQTPRTVEQGAEVFVAPIDARQRGNRALRLVLSGGTLDVYMDGKLLTRQLKVPLGGGSQFFLACKPLGAQANQHNIYDPVYDGVFRMIQIKSLGATPTVVFDNQLTTGEKIRTFVTDQVNHVINWFVQNL